MRWLAREWRALPGLMRLGFLVLALGGGADLIHHTAPPTLSAMLAAYLGPEAFLAHIVTLGGMALTLVGIFTGRLSHVSRT